jgi:hypothetical protein
VTFGQLIEHVFEFLYKFELTFTLLLSLLLLGLLALCFLDTFLLEVVGIVALLLDFLHFEISFGALLIELQSSFHNHFLCGFLATFVSHGSGFFLIVIVFHLLHGFYSCFA